MLDRSLPVEEIVRQVVTRLRAQEQGASPTGDGENGIFARVEDAVCAAREAEKEMLKASMAERAAMVAAMRRAAGAHIEELARLAVEETGMGRVEHKIIKNRLVVEKTPGVEDLATEAWSGDDGLTLLEMSPFGVIGAVTPSTNPTETVICNSIGMIAAGNTVVFSPHPGAKRTSLKAAALMNQAVQEAGGPRYAICALAEPSLENSGALMRHPDVNLLVATGGPGVVKAVLSSGKKAIGAGAGNPPAVVDDTADIEAAAEHIVAGAAFDNNLPCIAEKEVVVLSNVADYLIFNMEKAGAYRIKDPKVIDRLVKLAFTPDGKLNRKYVGRDAKVFLRDAGIEPPARDVPCLIMEVERDHPFVQEELMMPLLPIVRIDKIQEAMDFAVEVEHANRHTAVMHSKNIDHLTYLAKAIKTTIFVKNGPSYAGIGVGGEGFTTFTIAGPTGEGLTSARTFTRRRRCVLVDALSIR
ncbi:MAG TPA: aldehyde dehydrogenase EutE [Firmicutes bacterium]|nr:aldehyde dehydrogenase EutE [Bacillota bacterium]